MDAFKKIKILHVIGAMNRGGTETMVMNIYRKIRHDQIQFDFISYDQQEAHYDEEILKLGGKVIKLTKTKSIKQIYHVIKKQGPYHAVHAHTLFHCGMAMIAAKLARVNIRVSHAHTTMDKNDSFFKKIYIKLMRLVINIFSTHLLACSEQAGKYLFGETVTDRSNYLYFPNVIDYEQFLKTPQTKIETFNMDEGIENQFVIGHIGRFDEAKNHQFLLNVMERVLQKNKNVRLLLVGEGNLKEQVIEQSKKLGIYEKVNFVGVRKDIPIILHCMDVFVFPSLYEGLGLVLLEAQACGLPCIVSEAIQPEADVGLGLITKLSLGDKPDVWAKKVFELIHI